MEGGTEEPSFLILYTSTWFKLIQKLCITFVIKKIKIIKVVFKRTDDLIL